VTAELLSIGSELTTGETRDTNAGEIARALSARGVTVSRIQALPDELGSVTAAFTEAVERADLVVSTGGLGPTPDDLTREAIAAAWAETPASTSSCCCALFSAMCRGPSTARRPAAVDEPDRTDRRAGPGVMPAMSLFAASP
jgi:nicotinamide-nucleotide amidase